MPLLLIPPLLKIRLVQGKSHIWQISQLECELAIRQFSTHKKTESIATCLEVANASKEDDLAKYTEELLAELDTEDECSDTE